MRNKYSASCYYCGQLVNKGEGHFEKTNNYFKKWRTIHSECVLKQRELKLETEHQKVKKEGRS